MAVPSLKRLSPSMSVPTRFATPSSLRSATTATGSVADRIAPSMRLAAQVNSRPAKSHRATHAVSAVDSATPGTASVSTWKSSRNNVWTSTEKALSKMSTGRKRYMSRCGFTRSQARTDRCSGFLSSAPS